MKSTGAGARRVGKTSTSHPARTCLAACGWLALAMAGGAVAQPDPETATTCQVENLDPNLVVEARRLLDEVPLIDGHNDLPWALRKGFENQLAKIDLRRDLRDQEDPDHTDFVRLREGGVGAQFWSVYVPVELPGSDAVQAVIEQIDVVHRLVAAYPDHLELALTAADIERQHEAGKIASLIGIEGGHSINNSLAVLRQLYALGARYMTLTHWQNNDWADSATDAPENDGLSPFGVEVVREMNRLGMILDLSHVSEATMHDALDASTAPVIFSHSSARGVTPHSRNVPDSVLKRLAESDGVVMVTFVPSFVSERLREHLAAQDAEKTRLEALHLGDPEATEKGMEAWREKHPAPTVGMEQVIEHIDYLRREVGSEHIGIGSDFDGISSTPAGLEDVSCYPALFAALMDRGYSTDELKQIAGLNVLRVMRGVEAAAAKLSTAPPGEASIAELDCPAEGPCRFRPQETR